MCNIDLDNEDRCKECGKKLSEREEAICNDCIDKDISAWKELHKPLENDAPDLLNSFLINISRSWHPSDL